MLVHYYQQEKRTCTCFVIIVFIAAKIQVDRLALNPMDSNTIAVIYVYTFAESFGGSYKCLAN